MEPRGPVGVPSDFRAIDATILADRWDVGEIEAGSFGFLDERRDLGNPVRWDPDDATQLWLFHLHYWEWAWSLAAHPDQDRARSTFASQWRSWSDQTTFGRWNAWAPYPVSLRAWVLLNTFDRLVAGGDLEDSMVAALGLHAGFLQRHIELDIGGNHVIKNLKALVGLGAFLHDDDLIDLGLEHLDREVEKQVLADGGHFELSPSYHCQVLADFVDISNLLRSSGHEPVPALDDAVHRMRCWLGSMRTPEGGVPLFNDCEPVSDELIDLLQPGPAATEGLTVLEPSGYVIVRRGPLHLIADVGQPGPSSPPGHIHADCLSFVLYVHGEPVVVDSGTSEYGSGPRRQHERSTAAHNTVEVDGIDQTEVWGAFRAGRRTRATLERAEISDHAVVITASHDGYRHLPGSPVHRRTWTVSESAVAITDEVVGTGHHRISSRLHVPETALVAPVTDDRPLDPPPRIRSVELSFGDVGAPAGAEQHPSTVWRRGFVARGFGRLLPAVTVTNEREVELPAVVTTTIDVVS